MSGLEQGRSIAGSLAYHALSSCVEQAGGSAAALVQILWRIGAHPGLIAHDRVLRNLAHALRSETFSAEALWWAGPWRNDVGQWLETLSLIDALSPRLREEPALREFFRQPRHDHDHPLLRHGVGRHPIAAALYNVHESQDTDSRGLMAPGSERFELMRSHVLAVYFEARSRAAQGLDAFLSHDGDREFAPVPLGAAPVGLAMRAMSLSEYAPLLMQLPTVASTPEFAYGATILHADFSGLPRLSRESAARYLTDLQRYLAALPALLHTTQLTPRTRTVDDPIGGQGGSNHRPGWVGWAGEITRNKVTDWEEDAPGITQIGLPAEDEPDALEEETEGDMPGSTRDSVLELYDPADAAKVMSRLRFRRLHLELRSQELLWSLDVASSSERALALHVAQASIDSFLCGKATNQAAARLGAVGGIAVKACALYGWASEITAAISLVRVDQTDATLVESLCYVQHDQISLLVQQPESGNEAWTVVAFLLPEVAPRYRTQLQSATEATGRLRQRAFLMPDIGGLGQEILSMAAKSDRLPIHAPQARRVLAVESKTAVRLAKECLSGATDPINEDSRAALTIGRLAASMRAAATAVDGDPVGAWLITQDHNRSSEARLHYTQVRAERLPNIHQAALERLDGCRWKANDDSCTAPLPKQDGWVGCRHVVDFEQLSQMLATLQARLVKPIDLSSRSAIRRYHNDFSLHAWLIQSLCMALRTGHDRPGVWQELELRLGADPSAQINCTGMADKHNGLQDKSRLLPLLDEVLVAGQRLQQHNAAVIQRLDLLHDWRCLDAKSQRHFVLDEREALAPVRLAWIKDSLAALGMPVPVNFSRALLRTELLDRGCPGRCIDGLLGHFDDGQSLYAKHSSHDPQAYLERVTSKLSRHLAALGLKVLPSLCVPTPDRNVAPFRAGLALPNVGLKPHGGRGVSRPIWWRTELKPALPLDRTQLWTKVSQHASVNDRHWMNGLLWSLKNWSSPHAKALVGSADGLDGQLDESSARMLEEEVLMTINRHQLPRTVAASWLRLLLASQMRLRAEGVDLATTQVAALTSNPESPVSQKATLRLPLLAIWQGALHRWIQLRAEHPEEDPRYWAIAIGLSAVTHGMVLDMRLLSSIMEWVATPGPRTLQLCAGHDGYAFLEFELPSALPGSRQCVRWFPDPLTELLILRAPSFPVTPELRMTSRYVGAFLQHHGVPTHHCVSGWRAVMRVARAWWSTRVPQFLVQCATRGISTTSLSTVTWSRLFGQCSMSSQRSGALLAHSRPAPSEELTLKKLGFDAEGRDRAARPHGQRAQISASQWLPVGRDIDHLSLDVQAAHTWIANADDALGQGQREAVGRLEFLARSCQPESFAKGALQWLASTARSMIEKRAASEPDPIIGLRRVVSTLMPQLTAEMGNTWFSKLEPQQIRRVKEALTQEPEAGMSVPDLRRGIALLLEHEPSFFGTRTGSDGLQFTEESEPLFDLEDTDSDIQVDARILSVDEYQHALALIRSGIQPPLRPDERRALEDMLHLGVWTLARPREYMESRLGDFDIGDDDRLDLLIRSYSGHGLKTLQATRNVPLSTLAPPEVCERFAESILARLGGDNNLSVARRRELYFAAPEGHDARVHHSRLLSLLRQVLRSVTGDPNFRVYSLRHAGANWLLMALEADNSMVWERLWSGHAAMLQYVRDGAALRTRLLGTADRTDRRAVLAITKLQGHLAAATSFMHYLHLTSLLQLQAVHRFADHIPRGVLAAAAGVGASTFSEQGATDVMHALLQARARADWKALEPAPSRSTQQSQLVDRARWLRFDELQLVIDAHGKHAQQLEHIAVHFGRSIGFIRAVIEAAAGIGQWLNAHVTTQPVDGLSMVLMPEARMNSAERLHLDHLVQNIETVWRHDPTLAINAVGMIIDRTTRLFEELTLQDAEDLRMALKFFERCGMTARDLQFVLRRRDGNSALPSWALSCLGPYASVQTLVLAPDTRTSSASLEKWLRIRLIDRKGQALSQVLKRGMFSAWVNMNTASLDA